MRRGRDHLAGTGDTDGRRRACLELDGLDWHDDLCHPDCLTRRAHAQRLLVARPRLTQAQLNEMASQAWGVLPQSRREDLGQDHWTEGFIEAARPYSRSRLGGNW
ncbi:hypothetical protein [Kribbella sindirgiensis]|uniref:Uncharacterized protein n=1 Tax=Kribbella sindirgiensis TaxID=1124744 RepID=A0A4R0I7S9_9ACTN|nr:hypothetical protein [Kribbella sindirgiensis]TCC21652.1 hypothetical protein E0H50_35850 [Kribbella sindirgiensis]